MKLITEYLLSKSKPKYDNKLDIYDVLNKICQGNCIGNIADTQKTLESFSKLEKIGDHIPYIIYILNEAYDEGYVVANELEEKTFDDCKGKKHKYEKTTKFVDFVCHRDQFIFIRFVDFNTCTMMQIELSKYDAIENQVLKRESFKDLWHLLMFGGYNYELDYSTDVKVDLERFKESIYNNLRL